MPLQHPPSIIANHHYNEDGLVEQDGQLLVPVYIGNQFGFHQLGQECLDNNLYPRLRENGILPLCPFTACREYLDSEALAKAQSVEEQLSFWKRFNEIINEINYKQLMPHAKFMIALLDGGHAVDDGLATEISYFATQHGPVAGIRSDIRLADNMAAPVNVALRYFMDKGPYKGYFFDGINAYEKAFEQLKSLAQKYVQATEGTS